MAPYLFASSDLGDRLRRGHQGASEAVRLITEPQFLASTDDEIVAHLKPQWILEPLTLHEDAATMEQNESEVDVSGDPNRMIFPDARRGPVYVPGTEVIIRIPYTGAAWLWEARTSTFTTVHPVGTVHGKGNAAGTIQLRIALPHDAPPERFKQARDENLKLIRQYIEWGRNELNSYNQQIERIIRDAAVQRRQRLKKHGDLSALLNIPLHEKAGAPPLKRIPIEIRKPPPLPVPPKDGLKPEPGIDDSIYEKSSV